MSPRWHGRNDCEMGRNATRCDSQQVRAYDWAIANGIAKEQAPLLNRRTYPN